MFLKKYFNLASTEQSNYNVYVLTVVIWTHQEKNIISEPHNFCCHFFYQQPSLSLGILDKSFTGQGSQRTGLDPHRRADFPTLSRDGPTTHHRSGKTDPGYMGIGKMALSFAWGEWTQWPRLVSWATTQTGSWILI